MSTSQDSQAAGGSVLPRARRRLAAVVAADVAGYSRLMGGDEEATIAAWWSHRGEVIDPAIAAHGGRIVKHTGDGFLAEFRSVVEATRCALAIQKELALRNRGLPDERRMDFRIGINVCDIIADDEDVYGDGVNVAARLESIAEPGGICVTGRVFDEVAGKLEVDLEDLGEKVLKNISRPVRVYRIAVGGVRAGAPAPSSEFRPTVSGQPSVAVLPFDNLSGEEEQRYFSDGITEDIITDLSKLSGLFVIARNSSFAYRGKTIPVPQIARELGVRHVLEGSVRKAGNRVRITAQLIEGATGGHLWAERYDRDLSDIFAIQDEVTQHIVSALKVRLTTDQRVRRAGRGTTNLEAYDWYLRAQELTWRFTREANLEARSLFERAIALDSSFAAAYAGLAFNCFLDYSNGWSPSPNAMLERARELAQDAVHRDELEPQAHFALGIIYLYSKDHDRSIAEAERTLALDPNCAEAYALKGHALLTAGRPDEAIPLLKTAMRLNPYPGVYIYFLALAELGCGDIQEAVSLLRRRLIRDPNSDITRVVLASCYGHLGKQEEAQAAWNEARQLTPSFSFEHRRRVLPYKNPADLERIAEGLRKAGIQV